MSPALTVVPPPKTRAEKQTRSVTEAILINKEWLDQLRKPPFQRPLKLNEKVEHVVDVIKQNGGIIPGVLAIGALEGRRYVIDGQHRIDAFRRSGLAEGYADVRYFYASSLAEMGEEFVRINSSLVRLSTDDMLRGLEASNPAVQAIHKACPFVGFANVRRGGGPVLSMSAVLRFWFGTTFETPSYKHIEQGLKLLQDPKELKLLIDFLTLCYECWGTPADDDGKRLYTNLNMLLCGWAYRRAVLKAYGASKQIPLDMFKKYLMELQDPRYTTWLRGRIHPDKYRSAAWFHMKRLWSRRHFNEVGHVPRLPQPGWAGKAGRKT